MLQGGFMISNFLVYESEQFNPYINLAIEKVLFDGVDNNTLILYLWQNKNTVVIGKNQNPWAECNCDLLQKEGGFIARRMSGGGAVFHDSGNLNFTFICTKENYNQELNFSIIKSACENCGINAELSGRNDILVNGKKFSGNAFYHSGKNSYHHGTLLISTDSKKIERYLTPNSDKLKAKGVKSVESRVINLSEINPKLTINSLKKMLISTSETQLGLKAETIAELPENEIDKIACEIGSWKYIFGNTLPFSLTYSARLSFGNTQLNLNLEGGKISDAILYTDSLDTTIADTLKSALIGCEFNEESIKSNLQKTFPPDITNEILTLINKP